MNDILTTCPKCGNPIEVSRHYCKECKKLMKKRREVPWLTRTLLWLTFIALSVVLFLTVENTLWVQKIMRSISW
ncbi:DUF2116 family Zn-ribbon domain-containing protein [Desulfocurvibacter africanus]|uniref:Uncharacterized protein n=1 Tax=Desulfocurvibacter africanus subsp. africanus str. Walvis Bay TaxID=690850 RepID=F3Z022_DESAF|nr:DUF2116 family Zn-ribbon domain-containing protein [Desulfocurvibacter africanus]EGJ52051.1 hypothetical protein Desaf_3775 [Desulfocurvibacter africanus subsp. africanus str. Walvis Bay]